MKARISAIIGKLLYKYMYTADEATKLIMLKKAKTFYSGMLQCAGVIIRPTNRNEEPDELVEKWFILAKQEDLEL